jgi:DNA polymerase-3 subunit chi
VTRIDFYVLDDGARDDRFRLACRIAEKAWLSGHRVLVHAASMEDARRMDGLLWTFRDRSFVPHGLLGEAEAAVTPVLVGCGNDAGDEHEILINLADGVPHFFSGFERVIEPVDANPDARTASRERYRFYRDRGYEITDHRLAR